MHVLCIQANRVANGKKVLVFLSLLKGKPLCFATKIAVCSIAQRQQLCKISKRVKNNYELKKVVIVEHFSFILNKLGKHCNVRM